MNNPKPYFTPVEILILALVLLFTILLVRVIYLQAAPIGNIGTEMRIMVGVIWIICAQLQFKALRKRWVFVCWFILACIHFAMFLWLYDSQYMTYLDKYDIPRNHSHLLIAPIVMLTFFKICRTFSLKYYGGEMEKVISRISGTTESGRMVNGIETFYNLGIILILALIIYLTYFY